MEWTCVSADQTRAVGMLMQKLAVPNTQFHYYKPKGLAPSTGIISTIVHSNTT